MEINTIRYIFGAKKPELRRLVVKYGLPPAKNEQDLWHKTNYLVAKFQEEMLKDIAYIHPDRELILWSTKSEESKGKNSEEKSNCYGNPDCNCGVGIGKKPCGCAGATSNFEGNEQAVMQPQPQQQAQPQQQQVPQVVVEKIQAGSFQETLKNNMPLVVVGSLLLVGGLILFGNRKMS
jgi:hypothetical protein